MIITAGATDFTTSIEKALGEVEPNFRLLNGIIITGSHKPLDIENKLDLIQLARERNIPFLGICLGLQMAIEFSRNVLGVSDATSEEFGMGTHVVVKMPQM